MENIKKKKVIDYIKDKNEIINNLNKYVIRKRK